MSGRHVAICVALAALALVPAVATVAEARFYIGLFARIMVFAIAAVSLDLILGYGGLVSFGHAAYLGIGAYAVGILSYYGITGGLVYFVGIGLNEYGGDDGLNIARHSDFGAALNLDRPVVFYYFAYGLLLLFLF